MMASQPFLGSRGGSPLTEETDGNVNTSAVCMEGGPFSPRLLPPQQARIPTSTQKAHI